MAFGQSAGPAASHRQVAELLELLQNAGHADFKDARGPMGFNQRQAAGRFTADEAQALIDHNLIYNCAAKTGLPIFPGQTGKKVSHGRSV